MKTEARLIGAIFCIFTLLAVGCWIGSYGPRETRPAGFRHDVGAR